LVSVFPWPLSEAKHSEMIASRILSTAVGLCLLCNYNAIKTLDNREMEAFGAAVTSVLQKAVNEFLIVKVFIFREPNNLNDEINAIVSQAEASLVIEVMDFSKATSKLLNQMHSFADNDFCKGICFLMFDSIGMYKAIIHDPFTRPKREKEFPIKKFLIETFRSNLVIK